MRTIPQIYQVMLDCLDPDNMPAAKTRLQHTLEVEEIIAMREFNAKYDKKMSEIHKAHSLGMISEAERVEQEHALLEKKQKELQPDA